MCGSGVLPAKWTQAVRPGEEEEGRNGRKRKERVPKAERGMRRRREDEQGVVNQLSLVGRWKTRGGKIMQGPATTTRRDRSEKHTLFYMYTSWIFVQQSTFALSPFSFFSFFSLLPFSPLSSRRVSRIVSPTACLLALVFRFVCWAVCFGYGL